MQKGGTKGIFLVTGPPRTGKTTVLLKAAERLEAQGYIVGGMTSQELRERDNRVGFEIRDYASGSKGWLAHVRQPTGPRIGKYRVNINSLNSIGVTAILRALEKADITLIDEIGPMELCSEAFIEAIERAVSSSKTILATIHYRAQHRLVVQLKSHEDARIAEITLENRSQQPDLIANKIIESIKKSIR